MLRALLIFSFLISVTCRAQQKIPAEIDSTEKSKNVIPVEQPVEQKQAASSPKPPTLNGYFVLYNKQRKKTKDGIFKDNRLIDGKNYIYDANGNLVKIQVYQNGVYIKDLPPESAE